MEGDLLQQYFVFIPRYFYPRPHMEGDWDGNAYQEVGE